MQTWITGRYGFRTLAALLLLLYVLTMSGVSSVDAYYYFNDLETDDLYRLSHPHHLAYELAGKVWFEAWRLLGYEGRSDLPLKLMSLIGALGVLYFFGKVLLLLFPRGQYANLLFLMLGLAYLTWHYATEGEPVIFFLCFACFLIYAMLRLVARSKITRADVWLLILATSLGTLFHQALILALPVVLVVLWRASSPESRMKFCTLYVVASGVLVAAAYLVMGWLVLDDFSPRTLLLWSTGYMDEFAGTYGTGHHLNPGTIFKGLTGAFLGGTALKPYLFGNMPKDGGFILALLPFLLLMMVLGLGWLGLAVGWRRIEKKPREALMAILFFSLLFTAAAIYWEPGNRKFWAPIIPGLILLAGYGLLLFRVGSGSTVRLIALRNTILGFTLLALLVGNLNGGILHKHRMQDTDQELSLRLQEIYRRGDLVVLQNNRLWQSFDYHFPAMHTVAVEVYANPEWAAADTTLVHAAHILKQTLLAGGTGFVSSAVRDDLLVVLGEIMPGVLPVNSGQLHEDELFQFADSEQLELINVLYAWNLGSRSATVQEIPWNLTIFHTNDMHGAFLPKPATWREDRAEVGGMIAMAWHLDQQRQSVQADLLLDAGDFMTGNPICDIMDDGVSGAGFMDMMNALGYDATVVGNHEFDLGRANVHGLAQRARFPLLAADILDESGEYEYAHEPLILQRNGIRIGLMGVSCAGLFQVTTSSRTGGLSLRDQATAVREMIQELDSQTDLLVLITHSGIEGDEALARELAGSGLDIIVGGHSHTRLQEPENIEGIIIVQAGSNLTNLGRLDLQVADDEVVAYEGRLITLTAAGTTAGGELTNLVDRYEQRIQEEFGKVVGHLEIAWRRSSRQESNMGNYLSDCMRDYAQTDVAFLNSGGIRKNLTAGPVTLLDVKEILPFANSLVVFEVTGDELATILETNARAAVNRTSGILQVSGLSYTYREVGDHVEVSEITVGGQPLDRKKSYRVAAPDYVVAKADVYMDLPPLHYVQDLGINLADVVVAAIKLNPTIRSEIDGRINEGDRDNRN